MSPTEVTIYALICINAIGIACIAVVQPTISAILEERRLNKKHKIKRIHKLRSSGTIN